MESQELNLDLKIAKSAQRVIHEANQASLLEAKSNLTKYKNEMEPKIQEIQDEITKYTLYERKAN